MSLTITTFRRVGAILTLVAAVAIVAAPVASANHQDVGTKLALQQLSTLRGESNGSACDAICRFNHDRDSEVTFTTDTLGGDGTAVTMITDTLGGTGGAPLPLTSPSPSPGWPVAALAATSAAGALALVLAGSLLALYRRRGVTA